MEHASDATLLDVLIDGFEKNEILHGYHFRQLPLPTAEVAGRKFDEFVGDATRWKGAPTELRRDEIGGVARWEDLRVLWRGRGILVLVRAPWFRFWHAAETWAGEPLGDVFDLLREELG